MTTTMIRGILALGLAGWAVRTLAQRQRYRKLSARCEETLDNALDETFPASDPTATQDFAIPVNRQ